MPNQCGCQAFEGVDNRTIGQSRVGGWARLARHFSRRSDALLGRGAEQALLTSLLDEVATRGQALVLRGEPGIGKSRLLAEAARTARERGMTVLTATGVQSEAHLPVAG